MSRTESTESHHDADILAFALSGNLDDDNAGTFADRAGLFSEAKQQIGNRHHGAAQVDDPAHRRRHHRHFRQARILDDFLDEQDPDRKDLAPEHECQVLVDLRGLRGCARGR